jgi:hypothetical protein
MRSDGVHKDPGSFALQVFLIRFSEMLMQGGGLNHIVTDALHEFITSNYRLAEHYPPNDTNTPYRLYLLNGSATDR